MSTKNIYRILLKNCEYSYDTRRVKQLIIKIKKCKNDRTKDKCKEELFIALSKIIVKAINNFFNLVKKIQENKVLHTKEDICSECFIIMNKCIENSDISEIHKFYYYLNTSLNRGIYRLYEKNYKKHFDVLDNSEKTDTMIMNKKYNHHTESFDIDLKDFSPLELAIIKFKLSGQKLNIFLQKEKIPSSHYYLVYETVIAKLKVLYGEDEDLKRFFIKKEEE